MAPSPPIAFDAILFDLDGTLLDIDFDALMRDYLRALAPVASSVFGMEPQAAIGVVFAGTEAMQRDHPGVLNKEMFDETVETMTGVDIRTDEHQEAFARFYTETFPHLSTAHATVPMARELLASLIERSIPFAIATQPLFPYLATGARLRWAGIADLDLPLVTTYENSRSTKPRGSYFLEVARSLGADPSRCLMVGDDADLDLPASEVGMTTWYVGEDPDAASDHRGSIAELATFLGLTSDDSR